MVHDIDYEIEIDEYCEVCMTLIYMYHHAMITVDWPIDSYLY